MRQSFRVPTLCFSTTLALSVFALPILIPQPATALTASFGQPYHGYLVSGVPFPRQFNGYQIRGEDQTYTTPEVIGAMLDAIDGVQKQFPNTAPIYLGDFSLPSGGPMRNHRSHQNGRDVDLGMYAKGNQTLDRFIPMNEENLDIPKTWCLVEGLIRSQRVQYVFVDKRIQSLLYDYALARGTNPAYLDRLFGNSRGAIIQHVRNHVDHIHVRFYTPWSTLAAQVGSLDDQKRGVIEMAQQAYLPKKVVYYAKGSEGNLESLALSFGVSRRELCRWNNLHSSDVPTPGSCIVFYKRGFETEPVHLAQTLQPDSVPEAPGSRFASLRSPRTVSDAAASGGSRSLREGHARERNRKEESPVVFTYKIRRGDTIDKIARRNGIDPKVLADANRIKKGSKLQAGQTIKLAGLKVPPSAQGSPSSDSRSRSSKEKLGERSLAKVSTRAERERPASVAKSGSSPKATDRSASRRERSERQTKDSAKSDRDRSTNSKAVAKSVDRSRAGKESAATKQASPAKPAAPTKPAVASSASRPSLAKTAANGPSKTIEPKKTSASANPKSGAPAGVAKESRQPGKKKGS